MALLSSIFSYCGCSGMPCVARSLLRSRMTSEGLCSPYIKTVSVVPSLLPLPEMVELRILYICMYVSACIYVNIESPTLSHT